MNAMRIMRKCREFISGAPPVPRGSRRRSIAGDGFALFTVIGADVRTGCGIASDGPVIVAGETGGGIEAPWVEIDQASRVGGSVKADNAIVAGEVRGSIYGRDITLRGSARIGGEVVCERLHAAPEAVIGGRTHPSLRLNRALLRDLARIARDARAADRVDPEALQALARDALVFEREGAVFVTIFGHLALSRRWARAAGFPPGRGRGLRLEAKRPPRAAALRDAMARGGPPLTVIGDDVRIRGDLVSEGEIRVFGEVRGEIRCRDCVTGDASRIDGAVTARVARLAGHVRGPVRVANLTLLGTARIEGTVNFETIDARGGSHYDTGRQVSGAAHNDSASRIARLIAGLEQAA